MMTNEIQEPEELKPCPNCEGTRFFIGIDVGARFGSVFFVGCVDCSETIVPILDESDVTVTWNKFPQVTNSEPESDL